MFLELKMQMSMPGVCAYLELFIICTKKQCGNYNLKTELLFLLFELLIFSHTWIMQMGFPSHLSCKQKVVYSIGGPLLMALLLHFSNIFVKNIPEATEISPRLASVYHLEFLIIFAVVVTTRRQMCNYVMYPYI